MGRLANTGLIRWFNLHEFAMLLALILLFWLLEDHVLRLLHVLVRYWYTRLEVLCKLCEVTDGARAVVRGVCLTYNFYVHVLRCLVDVWRFIATGQAWIGILNDLVCWFATLSWSSAIWSLPTVTLSTASRLTSTSTSSHRNLQYVLLRIWDSLRLETLSSLSIIALDTALGNWVSIWVFTTFRSVQCLGSTQAIAWADSTRAWVYPLPHALTSIRLVIITDMERRRCINSDGPFMSFLTQHTSFDLSLLLSIFLYYFH